MPRLPRPQYANAIYHIVARGDRQQSLFHDDRHYQRFTQGLIDEVVRSGWLVLAYCWMPNHVHALIRTPQANLAAGMQHWLSGYANWYAKRNQRSGHLFQGRYKAFPVEDEGYYWNLSRYIHLNPCNGVRPLAAIPEEYLHSSYGGYARKSRRKDWIAYEEHHQYWRARNGGGDPAADYRTFVKAGLANPVDSRTERLKNCVYGSKDFLQRVVQMTDGNDKSLNERRVRRIAAITVDDILEATSEQYGVAAESFCGFRSRVGGRDVAAYLCRRYTSATLAELSRRFGLSHPDSSSDLVKRGQEQCAKLPAVQRKVKQIESSLGLNPESRT